MATTVQPTNVIRRVVWLVTAGVFLWLAIIAPLASILALLSGEAFYALWAKSMLILPWPYLLLLGVFRSKNKTFRWWVFQYLGVSAVCFSGALVGIVLSIVLPAVMAGQIALAVCVLLCMWGIYSAHRIHIVNVSIESEKIEQPVRLVQISDVHIGSRRAAYLEKVVKLVNTQKPDVLAITGDLIDENMPASDLTSLKDLACPVFYCSGNHERYVDYAKAIDNITVQGINVLSDSVASCCGLRILGIQDCERVSEAEQALDALVASQANHTAPFSVLLYHQPDLWDAAKVHGIDLTLSGHTHKGQVWPFGLLVRTRYRYVAGLFKEAASHLFVSQGTGTWGPIMRLGTRCEITVIELKGMT